MEGKKKTTRGNVALSKCIFSVILTRIFVQIKLKRPHTIIALMNPPHKQAEAYQIISQGLGSSQSFSQSVHQSEILGRALDFLYFLGEAFLVWGIWGC